MTTKLRKHSLRQCSPGEASSYTFINSYSPDLVVVEVFGPIGWVSDLCGEMKVPVLVCSIHEEARLRKNVKRKTAKDDVLKLARLAPMGELVPTPVPKKPIRERR